MSFADAVAENRRTMLGMTDPELDEILPILHEIRDQTAKGLFKFLKTHDEDNTFSMQRHSSLIVQIDDAIKTAEHQLPSKTLGELQTTSRAVGKTSLEKLRKMVEEGERRFRGAVTSLRLPQAKILVSAERTLMHRYPSSAKRYADEVGRRIRHDLAVGIVRGESVGQLTKRLLAGEYEKYRKKGPTAMADRIAERQFFRNEYDAQRLVRTEMNNAYNETQLEGMREANVDDPGYYKMWDATEDFRTCFECDHLNGEIVPIHANFHPGMVQHPPIHPNDRCTVVPWHIGWGNDKSHAITNAGVLLSGSVPRRGPIAGHTVVLRSEEEAAKKAGAHRVAEVVEAPKKEEKIAAKSRKKPPIPKVHKPLDEEAANPLSRFEQSEEEDLDSEIEEKEREETEREAEEAKVEAEEEAEREAKEREEREKEEEEKDEKEDEREEKLLEMKKQAARIAFQGQQRESQESAEWEIAYILYDALEEGLDEDEVEAEIARIEKESEHESEEGNEKFESQFEMEERKLELKKRLKLRIKRKFKKL